MTSSSSFPTFEQVLTGLELPADDETRTFDMTMGRRPASSAAESDDPGHLPKLVVALAGDAGVVASDERADLQIAELIGRGGMGDVWLARQRSLGREVALCLGLWNPALASPAFTSTAFLLALVAVVSWSRDVRASADV